MAEEAIVCTTGQIYSGSRAMSTTGWASFNPLLGPTGKKKPWLGPGLMEEAIQKIEDSK
jgi:hypothetical protein